MTQKTKDDLIYLDLPILKHSADITNQPCFSKVTLNTKISCSINSYLRISIIVVLLIGFEFLALTKFLTSPLQNIFPLLVLAWPLILLLRDKPLRQFDLYLLNAGVDMSCIPMPDKENDRVCVATRTLHPQLAEPTLEQRNHHSNPSKHIFDWLNSWRLQGLKFNVLRVVLEQHFADTAFLNKLLISLQLHRVQLLSYLLLLFGTAFWAYCDDYRLDPNVKFILRTLGLVWWWLAIYLYRKQLKDLSRWMEKTRRQFKSIHLPLFIWNTQQCYWHELTLDEIKKPFVEQYGLEAEKLITLTQSFLLVLHLTYLGFL